MKSRAPLVTGLIATGALAGALYLVSVQRELQSNLNGLQSASAAQAQQLAQLHRQVLDLQRTSNRLAQLAVTHERTLLEPPPATPGAVIQPNAATRHPAKQTPAPLSAIIAPFRAGLNRPPDILIEGQKMEVDGKRVDAADLREIPPARIERIEVLPGTPGPNSTAPTMNVVLRPEASAGSPTSK